MGEATVTDEGVEGRLRAPSRARTASLVTPLPGSTESPPRHFAPPPRAAAPPDPCPASPEPASIKVTFTQGHYADTPVRVLGPGARDTVVTTGRQEWDAFVLGVKAGEFDHFVGA
ncbi:hypothetical protein ACFW34_07215 [Streptomyces sp. NPDC058848]|uniref:hypothetical protein n=1 Tax=Streptomyces sp. NPDC058848 TaxID=3346650 RepID=UPI0036ADB64E